MEEIIRKYLAQRSLTDDSVARNMKKPNKSIKGCCEYIKKKALEVAIGDNREKTAMIDNDVVYGWAVHYFDEDNLMEEKKPMPAVAKVIVPKQEVEKPKYIQCDLFREGGEE